MPRAVVLLSGGLDSATLLALARADGFEPFALSVDYGQRHRIELQCAANLAKRAEAEHRVVTLDLRGIGGSARGGTGGSARGGTGGSTRGGIGGSTRGGSAGFSPRCAFSI